MQIHHLSEINSRIFRIKDKLVILDIDLAQLYGVTTKALNQAVKRNVGRFPFDFVFRITPEERDELVTKCDRLRNLKHSVHLPFAFTELGVAMLKHDRKIRFFDSEFSKRYPKTGIFFNDQIFDA